MADLAVKPSTTLEHRLAGIIWGDAKVGKTTWAMSLPGRKLLINFDPDGYLSIAHRDDFDLLDLSLLPAREAIEQGKKVASYILENKTKYQSVVFDSLTTLVSVALEDAVERGIGKSAVFTPTIDAPGLAGYGGRNNNANTIIDKILRATAINKQHCFFLAHTDDPEYDKKGENIIQQTIMLSAKIRNSAALKVSELYHLGIGSGGKRIVYTHPFGVLKPMGSRIFDTTKVQRFDLKYTTEKPDEEQSCSLASIYNAFIAKGSKLTEAP